MEGAAGAGVAGAGNPGSGTRCAPEAAGAPPRSFIYALGRVQPRFPRLAVEKEFVQVAGRSDNAGLTDREVLHAVLSQRQNRYLARQLCYVLTVEGVETYLLHPRDPVDFDQLVEAIRPAPRATDVDVVIGLRGPMASPDMCNGLTLPIVVFDQIYSFDVDALITSLPKPKGADAKAFTASAEEMFARVVQMADNAGATDEDRALNYLAVRYPAIYARTSEAFAQDAWLTGVDVRPSTLSGARTIVDVVFSYTNRNTDFTEKFSVRSDMTEEFPFLVTKLSPYYDR